MNITQAPANTAGLLYQLHSPQQDFCSSYSRTSQASTEVDSKASQWTQFHWSLKDAWGSAKPSCAFLCELCVLGKWDILSEQNESLPTGSLASIQQEVGGRCLCCYCENTWRDVKRKKWKTNTEDLGFSEQLNYLTYWASIKLSFRENIASLLSTRQLKSWFEYL